MIRGSLFILAFAGLFAFPWPYAAGIAFLLALYVPPAGLAFGLLSDALYYSHGVGFPMATFYGVVGSLIAFFANRFIRTHISDFSL
jgi:uncharacterized membrane protein YeaQ/YmgE (transglycosylase-associated protein family)